MSIPEKSSEDVDQSKMAFTAQLYHKVVAEAEGEQNGDKAAANENGGE